MAFLMRSGSGSEARRVIAFALAAMLLVATAPMFFFAPVAVDSVPALSLDICHPPPSIGSASPITLAASPPRWTLPAPLLRSFLQQNTNRMNARLGDAPDTPPPRLPA